MAYRIFKRAWPNGLEPNPHGRKTTLAYVNTEEEAREYCRQYNATQLPEYNPLSIKAEYCNG